MPFSFVVKKKIIPLGRVSSIDYVPNTVARPQNENCSNMDNTLRSSSRHERLDVLLTFMKMNKNSNTHYGDVTTNRRTA